MNHKAAATQAEMPLRPNTRLFSQFESPYDLENPGTWLHRCTALMKFKSMADVHYDTTVQSASAPLVQPVLTRPVAIRPKQ